MTQIANSLQVLERMAGTTGLEPAASAVTGQRSNQLNYVPTRQINVPALLLSTKQPSKRALGDPDYSQPGPRRQQNLSRSSAQKYPNSFSRNTEEPHSRDWLEFEPRMGKRNLVNDRSTVPVCPTLSISSSSHLHGCFHV